MQQQTVIINDTTLRDGEQSAGVAFNLDEKVSIAKALSNIGVPELEIGIPGMGREEQESILAVSSQNLQSKLMVWARMTASDIAQCNDLGVDMVDLSIPVSDQQISKKINKTRLQVLNTIDYHVKMALDSGLDVCIGGEDSSRADMSFLIEIATAAERAGARRFRFADTVGFMEPFSVLQKIRKLRKNTGLEIEMHAHDDFGLATANTLAAVRGGASHVNTTVHGLGERAGNAALEEVVIGLAHLYNKNVGIALENYDYVSQLVEQASGCAVPWHKSVVGKGAFSHEAGIHVDGMLKDLANYQGLPPSSVGRQHQFVLGKHSGTKGVIHAYEKLGVNLSREEAECLLSLVRQHVNYQKTSPSEQDLERFYLMLKHETSSVSYCEAM